jgi:hypothetical protein
MLQIQTTKKANCDINGSASNLAIKKQYYEGNKRGLDAALPASMVKPRMKMPLP